MVQAGSIALACVVVITACLAALPMESIIGGRIPDPSDTHYDLIDLTIPTLTGVSLNAFAVVMQIWPLNTLIGSVVFITQKFHYVREFAAEINYPPTYFNQYKLTEKELTNHRNYHSEIKKFTSVMHENQAAHKWKGTDALPASSFRQWTVADYHYAYSNKVSDPVQIATTYIRAVHYSNVGARPLRAVLWVNETDLLQQAELSLNRWKKKEMLSVLDGVLIVVKDEVDAYPYETKVGTNWISRFPSLKTEATSVARLRAAGAIIAGKTNMHEIGLGTMGLNIHYGIPRNPFNLSYHTGGSSSGSAAAVASGLVPIAVGCDGGGSIRIPSAFNGVVGLKGTFGRVSGYGAYQLAWTVAHDGPIAATVQDAAIAYAIMAGADPLDPLTEIQPPVHLHEYLTSKPMKDIRVGIYKEYNAHAEKEIAASVSHAEEALKKSGATIVEISIPNLFILQRAHNIIILSEITTAMNKHMNETFGCDIRVALQMAQYIQSKDFIAANQIRSYFVEFFQKLFTENKLDVILTPTTGAPAPLIAVDYLNDVSDLTLTDRIMRFATAANLVGLPAITVPFGYIAKEAILPIGVQLMGSEWSESILLRVASVLESHRLEMKDDHKPELYYDLLQSQSM